MLIVFFTILTALPVTSSTPAMDKAGALAILRESHFLDCNVQRTDLVAAGTVVELTYERDTMPGHSQVDDLLYLTVVLDSVYYSSRACPSRFRMNHGTHVVFDSLGTPVFLGGSVPPLIWIKTSDRILFRAAWRSPEDRVFYKAPYDLCDALFFGDNPDTLSWNSGGTGLRGVSQFPTDPVAVHNLVRRDLSPIKHTLHEIQLAIGVFFK